MVVEFSKQIQDKLVSSYFEGRERFFNCIPLLKKLQTP